MPRPSCEPCCNPSELARKIDTYRDAHLQILCRMSASLEALTQFSQLGSLIGANFNSTSDQAIAINATDYVIRRIVATNASISLTTAVGGIYAAASKTTALVANTQVYSALTTSAKFVDLTLNALALSDRRTEATLYLSLTTPQGAAATGDIYIFGDKLA